MNRFQQIVEAVRAPFRSNGAKALTIVRNVEGQLWSFDEPQFTYKGVLPEWHGSGDMLQSSVIAPLVNFMMRETPQAPLIVQKRTQGQWQGLETHAMVERIDEPNPYYDGNTLWMATVMDYCFGEAFWWKIRNRFGEVIQLWWMPRGLVEPKRTPGSNEFISYYDYKVTNPPTRLAVDDVVHFRFGIDPANPMRGLSQLGAIMREVYTDAQAAAYTAAVLKNLGVIGIVISPKEGTATKEDADSVKAYLEKNFTGENRGKPLALGRPTDVQVLQYNLQGLDLGPIRDVSEERASAALGLPAAVVGFGTGLQQTKVGATLKEMIQLAYKGAIIPTHRTLGKALNRALLPEFQTNVSLFRSAFDVSQVPMLWEDEAGKHDRVRSDWEADLITQGEARRELGYSVDDKHDRYHFEMNPPKPPALPAVPTPAGGPGADEEDDDDNA